MFKKIIISKTFESEEIEIIDKTGPINIERKKKFKTDNEYMIKCGISHLPYIDENTVYIPLKVDDNGNKTEQKCIFDLGCTTTNLFTPQMWDFKKGQITKKYHKISKKWEKLIGSIYNVNLSLATNCKTKVNQVFLTKPLYVNIEGLTRVPIHSF
jgi:hypothetical protein